MSADPALSGYGVTRAPGLYPAANLTVVANISGGTAYPTNIDFSSFGTALSPYVPTSVTVNLTAVTETYTTPAITAGTLTINLSSGTVFNVANTANITTFAITNAVTGKATAFTLILTANGSGYTQAWGASVLWADGSAPTLTTTNNKRDVLTFVTNDGGTTWFGFVGGQNF